MSLITRAQLLRVAPHATAAIAAAIVDHADHVLARYGLATTARLPDFMAHVLVESDYLRRVDEDLDYTAARIAVVFKSHFASAAAATPYAHNPQALANRVYGDRMGNVGPDDGWLNRGQGLIETTGHDNIARLAKALGKSFDEARTMLTAAAGMLECAAATYVMLGAPKYADIGDIVGSTRAINGGINGLADRRAMLALCRKVWPRVVAPAARAAKTAATRPQPPIPTPPKLVTPPPKAAPVIPPEMKAAPMSKSTSFLAAVLAVFGISITAAQAGTIDLTPVLQAGIDYIALPLLLGAVPLVGSLIVVPLLRSIDRKGRFIDQQTAARLADNIDRLLHLAISYGAQAGKSYLDNADFKANVDGWIAGWAADYAADHAPNLIKQAGGDVVQKILARLPSHDDVLALKATVAVNDNAPVDIRPDAQKAA